MVGKVESVSWDFGDEVFHFECLIRRSSRAKRINLKVPEPRKVILTIPPWSSIAGGKEFLAQQKIWVREKSLQLPQPKTLAEYFLEGGSAWLDESPRQVTWSFDEKRKRPTQVIEPGLICFVFPDGVDLEIVLLKELMRLAQVYLKRRLAGCEENVQKRPLKCRIGNQSSRWGSCSGKGTISLNWRILLLPFPLGNYVLYHELAHLEHMNHSSQFWDYLDSLVPGAKKIDKELMKCGKEIIRLGLGRKWPG